MEKKKFSNSSSVCQSCGVSRRTKGVILVPFCRFPKDEVRRRVWIRNSGLFHLLDVLTNKGVPDLRLCGRHFTDEMFVNCLRRKLNKTAVPTIFFGKLSNIEDPSSMTQRFLAGRIASSPTLDALYRSQPTPHDKTDMMEVVSSDGSASTKNLSQEDGNPQTTKLADCRGSIWAEYWVHKKRFDLARKALQDVPVPKEVLPHTFASHGFSISLGREDVMEEATQDSVVSSCRDDSCDDVCPRSPEEVSMSGYEAWSQYKQDAGRRKDETEPLLDVMETPRPRMEFSEAAALLQRLKNCEVFTWQNSEEAQDDPPLGTPGEMSSLCRLCAKDTGKQMVQISGQEGERLRLGDKISRFLPLQLESEPDLPQQVCRECVSKLSVCEDLHRAWERAERTFRRIRTQKKADLHPDASIKAEDSQTIPESCTRKEFFVPSPQSVELDDVDSDVQEIGSEDGDFVMVECEVESETVQQKIREEVLKSVKKNFVVQDTSTCCSSIVKPPLYCKVCNKGFRSLMMLSTHSFYTHRILMCGFCGEDRC